MFSIGDLPLRWREEADTLRHRGQEDLARMAESFADDLEAEIKSDGEELLTIGEAATLSGYSEEHLRRMARSGDLPTARNGDRGHYRVKRQDVPRSRGSREAASRARESYDVAQDARDIAERMRR